MSAQLIKRTRLMVLLTARGELKYQLFFVRLLNHNLKQTGIVLNKTEINASYRRSVNKEILLRLPIILIYITNPKLLILKNYMLISSVLHKKNFYGISKTV